MTLHCQIHCSLWYQIPEQLTIKLLCSKCTFQNDNRAINVVIDNETRAMNVVIDNDNRAMNMVIVNDNRAMNVIITLRYLAGGRSLFIADAAIQNLSSK